MSPPHDGDGAVEPPRELVVDAKPAPGDASAGSGSTMGPVVLCTLVAGLMAKFVSLPAALAALGAGLCWFVLQRKPDLGRFVLRVEDGTVFVMRERAKDTTERVVLADLLDVTLDKEAHNTGARANASAERVKLALQRRGASDPILLPEARITPIEGQEWQGKVRVFLRKHGWVPADER